MGQKTSPKNSKFRSFSEMTRFDKILALISTYKWTQTQGYKPVSCGYVFFLDEMLAWTKMTKTDRNYSQNTNLISI